MLLTLLFIFIGIFILYLFMICPNLKRRKQMEQYAHTRIAHRGLHLSDYSIPENSIPAYKEAIRLGVAIEIDIHITRDHQVVVFHDDTLKRMCGDNRSIESSSYQELQQYTLKDTLHRIPLFSEVLTLVNGQVPLLIELKLPTRDASALCQAAAEILRNYQGDYLVQSFQPLGLYWFKKHCPEVLRGQLSCNLTKTPDPVPWFFRFCVKYLLTNFFTKPDFISYKYADEENYSLYLCQHFYHVTTAVWTLRDEADFCDAKERYDMIIFEHLTSI